MAKKTDALGPALSFREYLRRRRRELSLTQVDVAREIGLQSPDFISLVEIGQRRLDLDRIPRLANVLQVDMYDLCRMALEEAHPILAHALFAHARQKAGVPVLTAADEAAEKLRQLPVDVRRIAINMIDVLFDKETQGLKVAASVQEGAAIA